MLSRTFHLAVASTLFALLPALSLAQATVLWEAFYPQGGEAFTCARAVRQDADGNLFASAVNEGESNDNLVLAKYGPSGARLWVTSYDPSGDSYLDIADMAVDLDGNLLVLANNYEGATASTVVLKLGGPNGGIRWTYTGPDLQAEQIVVNAAGHSFFVGTESGATSSDISVRHLGVGGGLLWSKTVASEENVDDIGMAIAFDSDGTLLVSGYSATASYIQRLVKLTQLGQRVFGNHFARPGEDVVPVKIVASPTGGSYVASQTTSATAERGVITHYDVDGTIVWRRLFNVEVDGIAQLMDLTLDSGGNLIVTGNGDLGFGPEPVVRKMAGDGSKLWQRRFGNGDAVGTGVRVVVGSDDSVYVVGSVFDIDSFKSLALKYAPNGTQEWAYLYAGAGGYDEGVDAVASGTDLVMISMSMVTMEREAMHLSKLR